VSIHAPISPSQSHLEDLFVQALRHVDRLVEDSSAEVSSARLWALLFAATARLRYRGVSRDGFAGSIDEACSAAEAALVQDVVEAANAARDHLH